MARLTFITDGGGDEERIRKTLDAAVGAGLPAVQFREPGLPAASLVALCRDYGDRLDVWINHRVEVALQVPCHGVWLGHRSLSPIEARTMLPAGMLIGCSVHDEAELARAAAEGADLASLAPTYPTTSKPGHPGLGPQRAGRLIVGAALPVLLLGGIGAHNVAELAATGAAGVMVMSAIAAARDPAAATTELLEKLDVLFPR